MTISPIKRPRIQLDSAAYEELCRQVLQRDSWRCQQCGSRTNLQVHHIELRSQSGDDAEENLIARLSSRPVSRSKIALCRYSGVIQAGLCAACAQRASPGPNRNREEKRLRSIQQK